MDDTSARRYAIYIFRILARTNGLTIVTLPYTDDDRRPGCEVEAWHEASGEQWTVRAPTLYEAAEALAEQVGIPIG